MAATTSCMLRIHKLHEFLLVALCISSVSLKVTIVHVLADISLAVQLV